MDSPVPARYCEPTTASLMASSFIACLGMAKRKFGSRAGSEPRVVVLCAGTCVRAGVAPGRCARLESSGTRKGRRFAGEKRHGFQLFEGTPAEKNLPPKKKSHSPTVCLRSWFCGLLYIFVELSTKVNSRRPPFSRLPRAQVGKKSQKNNPPPDRDRPNAPLRSAKPYALKRLKGCD